MTIKKIVLVSVLWTTGAIATNPVDCTDLYYGLFKKGATKSASISNDYSDMDPKRKFAEAQKNFVGFIDDKLRAYPAHQKELKNRNKATVFDVSMSLEEDKSIGVAMTWPPYVSEPVQETDVSNVLPDVKQVEATSRAIKSSALGHDLQGKQIYPFEANGPVHTQPHITMGYVRARSKRPLAADVHLLSHELSHILNWVPDEVSKCLKSSDSINARSRNRTDFLGEGEEIIRGVFFGPLRLPSRTKSDLQKAFSEPFGNNEELVNFEKLVRLLLECSVDREIVKHFTNLRFQLKALMNDRSIYRPRRQRIQHFPRELHNNPDAPGGGYGQGIGTKIALIFQTCAMFKSGIPNGIEAHKIIKKYFHFLLPNQLVEAGADYFASVAVTKFIKDSPFYPTPEAKKQAALDVLRSWPPSGYGKELSNVMNDVGSKKLNERRVLDILLANPDFRSLVGCEFKKTKEPAWCQIKK